MSFKKEISYVLNENYKVSADAVNSFYELKQFKLLLEKLSSRMQEGDSKEIDHIMKKILKDEHKEEKLISNLENVFQKAYSNFTIVMHELFKIIGNSNEASRLNAELNNIKHELAELIKIMRKDGTFEELISEAEQNMNYLKSALHEINLIMEKHKDLIKRLNEMEEDLKQLEKEV